MKSLASPILRIGIGVTFVWIGILIFQNPVAWGAFINPWARELLIMPLDTTMTIVAIFDIIVGALLIVNFWTRLAAVLGAIHLLLTVIVIFGNDGAVARDIGLFAATTALFFKS